MVFLDINTFYGPKSGGIRTYHRAKSQWFAGQREHVYYFIFPEAANRIETLSPNSVLVAVRGLQLTSDPQGYRLLWDYWRVWIWIRKIKPDVIEAGDAWFTSFFCLFLKATHLWNGTLISFYHSDPIPSYVLPWSQQGAGQIFKKFLAKGIAKIFYSLQRRFDFTVATSRVMKKSLQNHRVDHVKHLPFGVPSEFFLQARISPLNFESPIRLLYAGRLDADKGIELLWKIMPRLLSQPDFKLTVAGRGALVEKFVNFKHERFHFQGFVSGIPEMALLYSEHDVFLAPGPFETFGLGVLEAMAAGLLVVGPNQGGSAELLGEAQSTLIFSAHDEQSFLECILKTRTLDRVKESIRLKTTAQQYGTWDESIERMVLTWKRHLDGK